MGKRWTLEEDEMLVKYYEAIGDMVGTHDLNRPTGAATKRVKALKECGAWQALKLRYRADYFYLRAYMVAVKASEDALEMFDNMHPGAIDQQAGISDMVNGEWVMETDAEHIARDMREGIFPNRSPKQPVFKVTGAGTASVGR